jgi:putative glutamine amidotransferase
VEQLTLAGAIPVLLPPRDRELSEIFDWVQQSCHGLVITGGAMDIHPSHYGEAVEARLDRVDEGRTGQELVLARLAIERKLPVLGICGGMQILAVAGGGSLVQDIGPQVPGALEHEQPTDPSETWHPVDLDPGLMSTLCGTRQIRVNSTHHQAVKDPGQMQITGRAPDGVVEVIEHPHHPFCLGVQWHPELLGSPVFEGLVDASRSR